MSRFSWPCMILFGSLLAACGGSGGGNNSTVVDQNSASVVADANASVVTPAPVDACARIKTSGWKAWVNEMPGPGATRTLHVIGSAEVPTGGWTLQLNEGPLDKMMPPTQILNFVATPPSGIADQHVQQRDLKADISNAQPQYKGVDILCGRTTIATIPVGVAS